MTDRGGLRSIPSERDLRVLDWLTEKEHANAGPILDGIIEQLPGIRQVRPWPWTHLIDGLRPPPFGRLERPLALLVVLAALLVALLGVSLIAGGQRGETLPVRTPDATSAAPSGALSSSPAAFFPLAGTPGTIAYADGGAGGGALWLIGTDGSGQRKLGEDITGNLVQPDWSASGDRLLVLDQVGDREQLWEVDPTGKRPSLDVIPCSSSCDARDEASYSPDGDRIVFFEASGTVTDGIPTTCGIRIYTASRQAFDTVTASPCGRVEEREPRFAPDGQRIAFWRTRSLAGQRTTQIADAALFVRDLRTSKDTQVTDWPVRASSLDWSPDGTWLVFATDWWNLKAGDAEIWRVHPDGSGLQQLTHVASAVDAAYRPRYSPDGRWILYTLVHGAAGELWAIPAEGGRPVRVLPGIEDEYHFDLGGARPTASP